MPYDTIEITAVPPPPATLIGNTTDWLELVFTHEYTHILHLDRTRGFMQGVRRVFGRVPVAFPNAFLPIWQIEGIATFEESRMTGQGRIPAGDFRAIVDVAAAQGRFEPIDRAQRRARSTGRAATRRTPTARYFHQFLADRYGAERLAQLADATVGPGPVLRRRRVQEGVRPFVGGSVGRLPATRASRRRRRAATPTRGRRGSRTTASSSPRRASRTDGAIYYARREPGRLSGADAAAARRRAARASRGARSATGRRSRGDWIVFDQLERVRSVALYSDLYAVRASDGGVAFAG